MRLRSWLFDIVFYGGSVPLVLMAPISALFGQRALLFNVMAWLRWHRLCARSIMGIRNRIEGNVPAGPALYVAKHQSFYETFELGLILGAPVIVMKAELMRIPFWGWAARRYGMIGVDRSGSATALRAMLKEAAAARTAGRSVLLFPEGTRALPGDRPPLRAGFAALYKTLKMPTVPIALDSARVWPRSGPKRSGTVTFTFAPMLPATLSREEAEANVLAAINILEPRDRIG